MDEPVGRTIDGTPWEEARGPHLPDRLTRTPAKMPRASWAFVILAVATGLVLVLDRGLPLWPATEADIGPYVRSFLGLILSIIPPIATILFGAALFARQRQPLATHRLIAVGLVMLATGEALQSVTYPLGDLFRAATPPRDDLQLLVPSEIVYRVMTTILVALGTIYVARGVRAARLRAYPESYARSAITIALVASLLAVSSIVGGLVTILRASEDSGDVYLAYNASMLAINWLTLGAQAYLAVVLWSGMAAGEEPTRAWSLGTAGVWLILVGSASAAIGSAALYFVATPESDFTLWSWISLVWTTVFVAGYVLLLAAFTRGLPAGPKDDRPAPAG
jgi:hypothetical protein